MEESAKHSALTHQKNQLMTTVAFFPPKR